MTKPTSLVTADLPTRVLADRVIVKLREAAQALQSCRTIHQAKLVADVAAAQEVFAKRQQLGDEIENYAFEIKTHALGKLGEFLKALPKAKGTRGNFRGRDASGGTQSAPPEKTATYTEIGLSKKTAAVAQKLAALPEPTRQAIAKKETTLAGVLRAERRKDMQTAPIPPGKFRVVYADPPWHYEDSGLITDTDSYGRTARHYPTMTIAELCALDVITHLHNNAVLFLWVTSPFLLECAPVIKTWGFTYKTSVVWDKVAHNFGNYVSARHELLLICTRGSCLPDHPTPMPDSVISIPRSDVHSEKPEAFRALIDRLYDGDASQKLELFARTTVPGWTPYGNELLGLLPITA